MDRLRLDSSFHKLARDTVRAMLCKSEYKRRYDGGILQKINQQPALIRLIHKVKALFDRLDRRGNRRDSDLDRGCQDSVAQMHNCFRHCGGKKQRLALMRQIGNHPLHIMNKSHIKHTVSFIEHKGAHRGKVYDSLPDQII